MAPLFMERKQTQYREGKDLPRMKNLIPRRRGQPKGKQNDPKVNKLINTGDKLSVMDEDICLLSHIGVGTGGAAGAAAPPPPPPPQP